MYGHVPVPRNRSLPTWRRVLANYAVVAAIPLSFWAVSRPLLGGLVLAGVVVLFVVSRTALRAAHCLRDCGAFAVDLGGAVRITVARTCADGQC